MKLSVSRALVTAAAAVMVLAPVYAAPERPQRIYRELCRLVAAWDPSLRQTSIPEPPRATYQQWHGLVEGSAPASSITVNFDAAFPANARTAFQSAVDVWAAQVTST